MPTASPLYGAPTPLVITLASLATSAASAGRESTAIDTVVDDVLDYELGGFITTGTTPTANATIEIWVYGSYDGTNFTGGATGVNAALTPAGTKTLMRLAYVIVVTTTTGVRHTFHLGSVANMFGGLLPSKWGVWVLNSSGVALNATATNHELKYRTIKYESA